MNARGFFFVAAGLFLLAAAYTLGASRVQGQATSNRVVGITSADLYPGHRGLVAVTDTGDWYYQWTDSPPWPTPWIRGGNIGISPIGVDATTWGTIKNGYRK